MKVRSRDGTLSGIALQGPSGEGRRIELTPREKRLGELSSRACAQTRLARSTLATKGSEAFWYQKKYASGVRSFAESEKKTIENAMATRSQADFTGRLMMRTAGSAMFVMEYLNVSGMHQR